MVICDASSCSVKVYHDDHGYFERPTEECFSFCIESFPKERDDSVAFHALQPAESVSAPCSQQRGALQTADTNQDGCGRVSPRSFLFTCSRHSFCSMVDSVFRFSAQAQGRKCALSWLSSMVGTNLLGPIEVHHQCQKDNYRWLQEGLLSHLSSLRYEITEY
jgi:hypothetical protein